MNRENQKVHATPNKTNSTVITIRKIPPSIN